MYDSVIKETTAILREGISNEETLSRFLYYRAFASLCKGLFRGAADDCTEAMNHSRVKTKCLTVRGGAYMGMGNLKRAIADYEKYLEIEKSDYITEKLYEAKEALKRLERIDRLEDLVVSLVDRNMYDSVIEGTTGILRDRAIADDETRARFLYYRAFASLCKGFFRDAADDCTEAMNHSKVKTKCLAVRGGAFMGMGNLKGAIADYEEYLKTEKSDNITEKLNKAKEALEPPSKPVDYYNILEVLPSATADQLKAAYRKQVKLHHPDKHSNSPKKVQKEHEDLFKAVGEAYEVLGDPTKRNQYDRRNVKK